MIGKRAFDIAVSGLGLLFLSPCLLVIAVLIRLDSRGPALFRQTRVGFRGRLFRIYKFRTMTVNAERRSILVTRSGDSRITAIGRMLRKYKLDEMPQLINVLVGDMSIVGPRPEVEPFVNLYSSEQQQVLEVRPGITGLTQLQFRREEELLEAQPDAEAYYIATVMPAKLVLDLRYIESRTFTGDIVLVCRTILAVWHRNSADAVDLTAM